MLACAQKNTGAAQYSGVDIQRGEAALPHRREKLTGITGLNNSWVSRSFNIVLRLTVRHLAS